MPRVYPYTCRFCGETFKTRSALNLHKIAEHILESRPNQTANTGEVGVTWSRLTAASAAIKPNMGHTWEIGVKWWTQIRRIRHEWDLKNMVDRSYVTDSWLLLSNQTIDNCERQGKSCFWLLQLAHQTKALTRGREEKRGTSWLLQQSHQIKPLTRRRDVKGGASWLLQIAQQSKPLKRGREEKRGASWLLQLSHQTTPLTCGREEKRDAWQPGGCSSCYTKPKHWHVGETRNLVAPGCSN